MRVLQKAAGCCFECACIHSRARSKNARNVWAAGSDPLPCGARGSGATCVSEDKMRESQFGREKVLGERHARFCHKL